MALAVRAAETYFELAAGPYLLMHVAVGPTGKADDVAAVLFSPTFEQKVEEAFQRLPRDPLFPVASQGISSINQTRTTVDVKPHDVDSQQWRIRCRLDGSVVVSLVVYPDADPRLRPDPVFADAVRPAVSEALRVTTELGGFGAAHVVLTFEPVGFLLRPDIFGHGDLNFQASTLRAWAEDGALTDAALERWKREFLRDAGIRVHEP